MKKLRLIPLCFMLCVCLATVAFAYTANLYKEDGTTLIKSVQFTKGVSTSIPEMGHTETKYYLGYVTADGKQLHNYNIHTEYEGDLELTAKALTRREMVPGENFVENSSFDEDSINLLASNGTLTIVAEKNGNRVLEYSRGSSYASIQHYVKWEPGRKYRVSYRFMIPVGTKATCTINPRYWESQTEIDNNSAGDNGIGGKSGTIGEWIVDTRDFTIPMTCISHYKRDALSLYCEPVYNNAEGEDNFGIVYYDDISIIPYHKITYNANGGTLSGTNTEYFLNGTYTVNSALVPAREGYAFLGWGKTPDASANVSEIELSGKDITLYARWQGAESQPVFMYNFANDTKGIADGAMSIIAKDAAQGYTSVTLYYADENGILEGYTPLKKLAITDGVATYGISGKRAFPMEATKIYVVFSAEGKSDYTYVYDIPADKRITEEKEPVVSFYSLSDFHNSTGEYNLDGRSVYYTRENAIRDIFANKDRYDFVLMNGDNVCHSKSEHYAKFQAMIDRFNEEGVPAFFGTGNHEFHVSVDGKESPKLEGGNEEDFLVMLDKQQAVLEGMGYKLDREPNEWYYSFEAEGIKIIMCATPYPNYAADTANYEIAGEQLKWLENQLFDAEKSNKPVFVLSHIGIAEYIPPKFSNSDGVTNYAELKNVLNRHANLFFGSAHTHTNINVDWHTVAAGDQKNQFTHYNEGSVAYTYEYDEAFNNLGYETDYSVGYCVDVYDDMVVFRGRLFEDEADGGSKYISHATYQIMMPDASKELPELTLGDSIADGTVLTPKFDKTYDSEIASYSWYIDGVVVSTDSTYKVSVTEDTCGKRVACRVTFADGTYVSAVTDEIPGYKVTFDLDGGTGGSVMTSQDVVPNASFTPNMPATAPTMTGHYFAGWSVNKAAAEPDASFFASGNLTLYAVWKEGYTVSYDANGGTGSVPASRVVPKGLAQPHIGKPFPKLSGKFFVGWADTKDATEPMAKVNVKSDTTLYAVYSDEPKWYFDANLSGFVPNGAVTSYSLEDGKLIYSNEGSSLKDLQFENTSISFMAEDYPIMRVKLYGENASGESSDRVFDTVFFRSATSGYTETVTKIPLWYSLKVAEADGMSILEIVIAERNTTSAYAGEITALRFDALSSSGIDGYTDYLVFTDKKGIYKANVTVADDGSVTLSDDTVNCTASAVWNDTIFGKTVTVTLTPDEGYEFTTREDVLALTTINGKKPDGAVVLSDGSAKIWLGETGGVVFGTADENALKASVKIDRKVEDKSIVIAVYSGDVLCGLKIYEGTSLEEGYLDVTVDDSYNASIIKVFTFDTLNSMKPSGEPFTAYPEQ